MYGRIPERKFSRQDYELDCKMVRSELDQYLNEENKRVNVDSAKKKAVIQRFDYEGFRQMVLGANLFCLKTKDLLAFSQGDSRESGLQISQTLAVDRPGSVPDTPSGKQIMEGMLNRKLQSQMSCLNFKEFKRWMDKFYRTPIDEQVVTQVVNLVKAQNQQSLEKVFGSEFDTAYFVKLIRVFTKLKEEVLLPRKQANETSYLLRLLEAVGSLKKFRISLKLMLAKERQEVRRFLEGLELVYPEEERAGVSALVQGIIKLYSQ